MASAKVEGNPKISLELSIAEAKILRAYMQNPLLLPGDEGEQIQALRAEDSYTCNLRQNIFASLDEILERINA